MIRTHILRCDLPKADADALNHASGERYSQVMVFHWRTYRHTGHWLSRNGAERWNDRINGGQPTVLQAHSIDAAQQAFHKACKTAKANRHIGAKYPHRRKWYRTTIWKQSGIRINGTTILLSRAKGQPHITIRLPSWFDPLVMRVLEARLVWDRCTYRYTWHLVVENGKKRQSAPGANTIAVDLGEIHPAAATDGQTAIVVSCRELRAKRQYTAKRLADLQSRQSRCKRKSRRWWKLQKVKNRFRAKQQRRIRDMEHKISRTVVDYAVEQQAGTLAIGDVRDIADKTDKGTHQNQRLSTWRHGKLRSYLTYKADAEGMAVVLVDEHDTTKTCPNPICNHRHKPAGRVYRCPVCGFQAHRDVVGAVNILSRQLHGDVGKIRPPPTTTYRHPVRPGKRSSLDTGQPFGAVAFGTGRQQKEAAGL